MGLGWGTFFGFLGELFNKLPIQGREERWRNELDNLNKERITLLSGSPDSKKAARYVEVEKKIVYLTQLLKNVGR